MSNEEQVPGYSGIGGWLKFLLLCLMWLGPLLTAAMVGLIVFLQFRLPGFGLTPIIVIGDLFFLAMAYFSYSAGTGLRDLKPGAVQTAKFYFELTMAGCFIAACYTGKLIYSSQINSVAGLRLVGITIYPLIYSLIWYGYLSSSIRVRNTYH